MKKRSIVLAAAVTLVTGCLGAVQNLRSYYVLSGEPGTPAPTPITGTIRVSNLNADSVYEKFQIVVRQSPYQLRYSDLNVWAVKPNSMVSDIIARSLLENATFTGVTRVLGDRRPDYMMSGDLHAIEIYDSDDLWYAHLSIGLHVNRFTDGERVYSYAYDQRKLVTSKSFAHAVRALSELLSEALRQATLGLNALDLERGASPSKATTTGTAAGDARAITPEVHGSPTDENAPGPIYVPEKPKK